MATITADPEDYPIWPPSGSASLRCTCAAWSCGVTTPAGGSVGPAGLGGPDRAEGSRAQWIRVDVWRSNKELHAYYERRGFTSCGESSDPDYPSGALFQKPTRYLEEPRPPLLHRG